MNTAFISSGSGEIPVLIIFAPTATGKTVTVGHLFSDNVPSFFSGKAEIINADSMQVYKGLDIGTAKASSEFLFHLPHHIIDVCSPKDQFGSGDFVRLADLACKEIFSKGKLPVICGGTAFYIKNFIYGLPITPTADEETRKLLQDKIKQVGAKTLYEELKSVDEVSASKIHINDEYRILRALEVYYASGKPLSSFELPSKARTGYKFLTIWLYREREELYSRINKRVLEMFDSGLISEMRALLKQGLTQEHPGLQAIGYKEFFTSGENPYEMLLEHEENSDFTNSDRFLVWVSEIKRQIQRNTRHYAKRQITFFEPLADVFKIDADNFELISQKIKDFTSVYLT